MRAFGLLALVVAGAALTACSATRWEEPAPRSTAATPVTPGSGNTAPLNQDMTRTKAGNPPFYEVFGVRYQVMNKSTGYREQGIASWYGKKFHGRSTSNGERYDMHRMTAAHKTLPLPTNVRVTNLQNGRSVIVRVNDRGPFVKNRLIDLSYAAAQALDIVGAGTAPVEVTALDTGYTGSITTASATQPPAPQRAPNPLNPISAAVAAEPAPVMYVQVGAFGEPGNAQNLATRLAGQGISGVSVQSPDASSPNLYKVRIGPFSDIADYDRIVARVAALEITTTHLVVESTPVTNTP